MRAIFIGLALALIAAPVWAQTRADNVSRCLGGDPDARVAGCSVLIQSGQETSGGLAVAYNNRGLAYKAKGLHDPAIADFTQAVALNPQLAEAYVGRGAAYGAKGLYDEAIADETQAIALNPQSANAYNNRGLAYEAKGLHDQAIADYRAVLKLNPTEQDALNGLKRLGATP